MTSLAVGSLRRRLRRDLLGPPVAVASAAALLGASCARDPAPRTAPSPPPSPALPAAPAAEYPGAPSLCPADMVEVQGDYCTKVEEVCLRHRKRRQCAEFQAPTACVGPTEPKHYCIDRYEFPNRQGSLPEVMISWNAAKDKCAAIGKRLCTDAEWTLACEGPERLPFPYGYVRDSAACAIDKPSPRVDEQRLFSSRTQADELRRLDQREPSGSRDRCVSPFGVHDMTGSVDELVVNERGVPYRSALKGGNWGEYRNACRPTTFGHGEGFYYYQIGFRCCRDPDEESSSVRHAGVLTP